MICIMCVRTCSQVYEHHDGQQCGKRGNEPQAVSGLFGPPGAEKPAAQNRRSKADTAPVVRLSRKVPKDADTAVANTAKRKYSNCFIRFLIHTLDTTDTPVCVTTSTDQTQHKQSAQNDQTDTSSKEEGI